MAEELIISGSVTHNSGSPVAIKIDRGKKGVYGWEVEVRGTDEAKILERIKSIDIRLEEEYGTRSSPQEGE